MKRRHFLAQSGLASVGGGLVSAKKTKPSNWPIVVFEKPIQTLNYDRMGEELSKMGLQGIEATIRRGGHIDPKDAETDVPKMVASLAKNGQKAIIAASNVNAADEKSAEYLRILKANGITKYRMDYYRYDLKKDLLPQVTNPKGASSMDGVAGALEEWDTSLRLFRAADGQEPPDEQKRLTLLTMLPAEVSAYVAMHLEMDELSTFTGLKRFTLKYVKVLQNLKRKGPGRPAHLVEQDSQDSHSQSYLEAAAAPPPPALEVDTFDLSALEDLEPQERIEVLAVMAKQGFRFKRPQGGGPGGRPPPKTGPQFRFGDAPGRSAVPPPRGRNDISCANCGRKGHAASECRQPKVELADRPCFNCGKTGHKAYQCPQPKKAPVKAIEDAKQSPAFLGCVQIAPAKPKPEPQPAHIADFIPVTNKKRNNNRYQPLTQEVVQEYIYNEAPQQQQANQSATNASFS